MVVVVVVVSYRGWKSWERVMYAFVRIHDGRTIRRLKRLVVARSSEIYVNTSHVFT